MTARQRRQSVGCNVAIIITSCLAAGCGKTAEPGPTTPTSSTAPATITPVARAHLDQLLNVMESNSINRQTIDWNAVRAEVLATAGAAQTIAETMPAIRVAIARLRDGHSSYRSASGTVIFVSTRTCSGSGGPGAASLPATIGYVSVSAFSGNPVESTAFANAIQSRIREADRDALVGWIVDLRGNGGGNMWPMIAGLGPILGDDVLGFFVSPSGAETRWEYRDGASWSGGTAIQRVDAPYRLRDERPRVAVLSDNAIASSGEATLIAFRQRPETRSFGAPSCGLSTANSPFTLSDGAVLNLTTAVMADRAKVRYGDSVMPDELINGRDELIARAVAWLETGR